MTKNSVKQGFGIWPLAAVLALAVAVPVRAGELEKSKMESGIPFAEALDMKDAVAGPVQGKTGGAGVLATLGKQSGVGRVDVPAPKVSGAPAEGKWWKNEYVMTELGKIVGAVSGLGIVKAVGGVWMKSGSLPGAVIASSIGLYIAAKDYQNLKGGDRKTLRNEMIKDAVITAFLAVVGYTLPPFGVVITAAVVGAKLFQYAANKGGR